MTYQDLKDLGLCVKCRSVLPEGYTKVSCPGCVDKERVRQKKRRERLASEGLCVMCGGTIEDPGYRSCSTCRKTAKVLRECLWDARRSAGQCVRCGAVSEGFTYCQSCRDMFSAWMRACTRKKKEAKA